MPGVGLLLGLAGLFVGLCTPSEADIKRAEYFKDYKKPDPRVKELYWEFVCAGYDIDAYEDAINQWNTNTWSNECKPPWLHSKDGRLPNREPWKSDFKLGLILPPRTTYEDYKLQILARMCERRGVPFDGKNVY